jgi:hypothetical protein
MAAAATGQAFRVLAKRDDVACEQSKELLKSDVAHETTNSVTSTDDESSPTPSVSSTGSTSPGTPSPAVSGVAALLFEKHSKAGREIGMFGPTYAINKDDERSDAFWKIAKRENAQSAPSVGAVSDSPEETTQVWSFSFFSRFVRCPSRRSQHDAVSLALSCAATARTPTSEAALGQQRQDPSFVCSKADSGAEDFLGRRDYYPHDIELCPDQFEWLQEMMHRFQYESVTAVLGTLIHYCNKESSARKKWIFKTPRCRRCSQSTTGGPKVTARVGINALHWEWLTSVQERCAHASVDKTLRILIDAYELYSSTDADEIWGRSSEN